VSLVCVLVLLTVACIMSWVLLSGRTLTRHSSDTRGLFFGCCNLSECMFFWCFVDCMHHSYRVTAPQDVSLAPFLSTCTQAA